MRSHRNNSRHKCSTSISIPAQLWLKLHLARSLSGSMRYLWIFHQPESLKGELTNINIFLSGSTGESLTSPPQWQRSWNGCSFAPRIIFSDTFSICRLLSCISVNTCTRIYIGKHSLLRIKCVLTLFFFFNSQIHIWWAVIHILGMEFCIAASACMQEGQRYAVNISHRR